ncbi:hypothetical protein HYY72_00175 [Candidatus Woesearchaeota archaeon]|nr:hypothetical protein [Candidatus Woesearchaeota archaeon]
MSPSSPNSGDNVVVRFYANNPSAVDINSGFRYGLYVDNSLQDYCDASGRKAGESKYCDSNAFKLSKGTHTLKVVVDSNHQISESDENNNEKTQQLTITGRYDLYPGDFTWTPSNPDTDSSIKITMRAGNYGPDDVDSSFDYKLYIDNEWWATCTASGRQAGQVGECDIDGIRLFSGTHTLKNVVDPDNDIHETNENNNVKTQNLQVSSKTSYDLIPDGMTVSPSNPKNSDSIKVTYWAKNIGNTDITSSFRYGLYVDGVLKDYCTASGRKAGESKYCASDPLSLSAGGHTLKVVVDIDNDIPETREDNNEQTQILHVENADYVDLTPTDFEISPSNPRDNDLISITFQVTNTGTKPSGTFKSKLYIDNVLVHTCNLDSPVQPGSVWYCTHKRFLSAGSHTLKNSVDTENSVQESNEGNNVGYYNLDVSRNSCPIPDGSSSDCDCNSNADCPPSHPFCEENYPSPIRDGWDGCLASEPDYCGNGKCVGSENYNNCYVDCGQYAQKGSINVDVFYNSGPKSSSPIQNANVYLDDSFQGLTDLNGRKSFQASYGTRTVKVTCPDGVFCNSRSINVDGVKYASFGCPCSLPGDRDNDGIMDNDEVLIGSDPNNANSNLQSVWGTKSSDVLACLPTGAVLLVIWKKNIDNNGDWIQANDKVVAALNVTKVTSANIQEKPFLVAEAISSAGLDADIVVNKSYTLEQSAKTAERMDAVITHDGTLIIATDRESRTTTITSIGAMCSGAFAGSAWGIGQGVYDDVSGLFGAGKAIVTGLWFVVTSKDRFNKIGPGINDLITSVKVLLSKPGEAVWGIFRSTLEKGRIINPWREDRFNNRDSYVDFQIGFFSGFIQGYVVEQVFGMAVGIGVVSVAVKSGKLFAIFGKVSELSKKLVIIRDAANLGAEVAEKMSQLRYINAAVKWGDEELNALGRMMKLDEGWTKGLSEAEAKLAASRISKLSGKGISDGTIEKLVKSNVGKNTLKASEYSDELISKQAKLVEAIGSEGIDSVASRFDGFWPWQKDGWKKVNSFINELPEGSITSTTKKEAMINIIASSDFEVIVDSLRNLKGTEGLQDAVKAVLDTQQDTRKIADNIVKANELKQSGRTIESLEKPFYYPNGNLKGQFDIVYKKSGGETIYMEHKMRDWPTIENRAISDDMIDQMRRYNEEVGNWDQIRLSSRTSMPNWLIENLKKGLGSDVVQKILRGD